MISDKDLRRSCETYAEKYGYKRADLERGLEAYAAHLFVQEEGFDALLEGGGTVEADLREMICRNNDLGIDVVLEDEVGKRVILVQAAWRSKKRLEEDKLATFFDVPARIVSTDYVATGDEQIQALLAGFSQKMEDGYEIQLRFVTNLRIGEKTRLLELVDARNQQYQEDDKAVVCELYGASELMKRDEELRSATRGGYLDEVILHLQEGFFVELQQPYRTVIAAINANELVDLYNKRGVRNKLFNLNIRLPLTTQKVNPKMVETAVDDGEAPHFFYYNNGVSAVCSSYRLDRNFLKAERFQIINGAQTVSALVRARGKTANLNVTVLFRLTETPEAYGGPFTERIIRFNNTQNPVKSSDFFSNDDIQVWLRDNFRRLSGKGPMPVMYYAHKAGYRPKGASGKGMKIDQLAGIRHAFLYGPVSSYKEPQQFFDRNLLYWEAFGIDGSPATSWGAEDLAQTGAAIAVHQRVQDLAKKMRTNEKLKSTDEAKYLYRLARYVTALVGVGLEAVREDTFADYETLIASSVTFDKHVEPVLKKARFLLRVEWRRLRDARGGVQPEYNLARDEKIWKRLKAAMREEVLSDIEI